ncbi:MAG: protein translocase subunit SecF [Gammaproteobacteria bacterium]|nr:protein translocase subunit SecF [Gammaproteobacteria bacterium]
MADRKPGEFNIDFMGHRHLAVLFSALLLVGSAAMLAVNGLKLGIDFTGGTLVELGYAQPADLDGIRATLAASEFGDAVVQHFGSPRDVLVRLVASEGMATDDVSTRILDLLPNAEMRRIEFVGPQVGEELTEDGALAMLYALGGILVYVMLRFTFKFSLGAIAALIHDVLVVLGFFAVTQMEFDLPVLAALLAVIGYSLNDTIVVFDRIRENFRRIRKSPAQEVINRSLNQTLSRTLVTSLTTLLVLVALFFLGGELIHAFAAALIVGVVIGTYSSIFVASAAALALGVARIDLMPVQKEGATVDERP